MAEICVFCKEQIGSSYPPRLEETKMFMFEILMEQTPFDKNLIINSPMCDNCDKTISNFFNFKSNFMETEDEFINYMDCNNKVDLYDVLVKTFKLKKFENENVPIRICRICFKATQLDDYKEIKSVESKMAKMVTMCLPEFNIKLTNQTYLCSECDSLILQYYHFLLLCIEVTKSTTSSDISDPLSRKSPSLEIIDHSLPKLPNKIVSSEASGNSSEEEATQKTSVPSPRKRISLEVSESDPLAFNFGEPKDKKRKVENESDSGSGEASDSLESSIPLVPPRRPRGRPRTKPIWEWVDPLKKRGAKKRQLVPKEALEPTSGVQYECQICPEILFTLENLDKHIENHKKDRACFCWQCGYECYGFGAIHKHIQGHGRELYKTVKNESNEDDTFHESSSENRKKDTPLANDGTVIDDLLSVKCCDIYTPPDVKKAKRKKRRSRKSPLVASSSSTRTSTLNSRSKTEQGQKENRKSSRRETDGRIFQCLICMGVFDSITSWTDHITCHRNQSSIGCWRCGEWFESLDRLRDHFFKKHFITSFYKLVPPKVNKSSNEKKATHTSVTNKDVPEGDSSRVASSSESAVSCIQCNQTYTRIDAYMGHACKGRRQETPEADENVNKQEFGCGHCNAIFYSLDDLDEHNCIPTKSAGDDGGRSGDSSLEISRKSNLSQIPVTHNTFQTESTAKPTDADYECSYCLRTFSTATSLNKHICTGDMENATAENAAGANTTPENTAQQNTAPVRTCEILEVKKESLFECSYCVVLFESGLELSQHKCGNAPSVSTEAVSIDSETILDCTEDNLIGDGLTRLIKADPDIDCYLSPNSDCEPVIKNPDDVSKSRNVENGETSQETPEMARMKQRINKVANIFGVNIVEGKDRRQKDDSNGVYNCVGCGFEPTDRKDLMYHIGFCEKIFKCNYCSFGTNISQKLEIHCWFSHNILLFVCSWCTFVTSMEENYFEHILTHKDSPEIDDVQCISDDEDVSAKTPQTILNDLFTDENIGNDDISMSERVRKIIDEKKKGGEQQVSANENQSGLIEVVNKHPTTVTSTKETEPATINSSDEDTLSAENLWPEDSNDDLDDPDAFRISREDRSAAIGNVIDIKADENDPPTTEPVWLVKFSSVNKRVADGQAGRLGVETVTRRGNSDTYATELIIPDRIMPEPRNFKFEPLEDPLAANTAEIDKPETSAEISKSSTTKADTSKSPNSNNVGTITSEPSRAALNVPEPIVINCDSDSDSEFVESSALRISAVAACAEEVVTISASEASKLISQGVPVISKASFVAMQIEASPKAGAAPKLSRITDAVVPTEIQSVPHQSISVLGEQNQANDQNDSVNTASTAKEKDSTVNDNKEREEEANLEKLRHSQAELTKQSSGDNRQSTIDKENNSEKEDTTTNVLNEEADVCNKDDAMDITKSNRKIKVTIERELDEDADNSNVSSFFVTDNEDSDKEDPKEPGTKSSTSTVNDAIRPKLFLPVVMDDDDVLFCDEEDDRIENVASMPDLVNTDVEGTNKKVCESSTTKSGSGSRVGDTLDNSETLSTVNIEESFVISDDDEDVPVKENNVAVKERKVSVKKPNTPVKDPQVTENRNAMEILSEAIKSNNGKNVIIRFSKNVSTKDKISNMKAISGLLTGRVKRPVLAAGSKNVPVLQPATKVPASIRSYSKLPNDNRSTSVQRNAPTVKEPVKRITSSTNSKVFSNESKNISAGAVKDPLALATYSKTSSNRANVNSVKKSTPSVQKEVIKKAAVVTESLCYVIDDEDDTLPDKGGEDKTETPRSRNDSSSSGIILDRDFSKGTEKESAGKRGANDSGDDCVFVSEDNDVGHSKNVGQSSKTAGKLDKPPNALNLFIAKVKNDIKLKYPDLHWGAQKSIIMAAWRSLSNEDKWPFKEEARLHRILFKRENPLVPIRKGKVIQSAVPVVREQAPIASSEDTEPIVLD